MDFSLLDQLQTNFKNPLPGKAAQLRMAHGARKFAVGPEQGVDARKAGVLALLYPKVNDWFMVFIERSSSNPNDRHKGQIGFPGGQVEKQDKSIVATALREAEEEVGVKSSSVQVIGQLTDLYIPVSNFRVYPTVGYLNYEPEFHLQESEVAGIIEVPFEQLMDPSIVQEQNMAIGKHITLNRVPYFAVADKVVWGATAMILNELLEIARSDAP